MKYSWRAGSEATTFKIQSSGIKNIGVLVNQAGWSNIIHAFLENIEAKKTSIIKPGFSGALVVLDNLYGIASLNDLLPSCGVVIANSLYRAMPPWMQEKNLKY